MHPTPDSDFVRCARRDTVARAVGACFADRVRPTGAADALALRRGQRVLRQQEAWQRQTR